MRTLLALSLLVLFGCTPDNKVDNSGKIFDATIMHQIEINVDPTLVAQLDPANDVRVPCQFIFDGEVRDNVGVRLKTGGGSLRDINGKAGFSVKFDEFVDQELFDVKKLSLGNSVQDHTFVAEAIAYELFRRAGAPAPRVSLAELTFNGEKFGVYVLREVYNKQFLKRNFADPDGNLYEGEFLRDVSEPDLMSLETNEERNDKSDIIGLADAILNTPDGGYTVEVGALVDLNLFFKYWAVEATIYHWDGYAVTGTFACCSPNNYFVYHDPTSDKFVWLPHGADQTFGIDGGDLGELTAPAIRAPGDEATFAARLFTQTGTQERLSAAIQDVINNDWDTTALLQQADALAELVRATGLDGTREELTLTQFEEELAARRQFIQERPNIVKQELGF